MSTLTRRTLTLLVASLATIAVGAPGADAQETSVEVYDEATSFPCFVPCSFGFQGDVEFSAHLFGFEAHLDTCTLQLEGTIDWTGAGTFDEVTDLGCQVVPCNGAGEDVEERDWDVGPLGETAPGVTHLWVVTCMEYPQMQGGTGTHCDMEFRLTETSTHNYRAAIDDWACGIFEATGALDSRPSHGEIEIAHL